MKTLTPTAIKKLVKMFSESIDHAVCILNGSAYEIGIFRKKITDDTVRIFVFLDDSIEGSITEVHLIDVAGDVVAIGKREFVKPNYKGLYSIFKYRFSEVEEEYTNE